MRNLRTVLLATALAATTVSMGQLQLRNRMTNFPLEYTLLQRPDVGAELKLTPEQKAVAVKATADLLALMKKQKGYLRATDLQKTNDTCKKALRQDQQKRLRELWFQRTGPVVMTDARIAREVGLSQRQQFQLGQTLADLRGRVEAAMANGQPVQVMSQAGQNIMMESVLTDSQRTRWQRMQGEPFLFSSKA